MTILVVGASGATGQLLVEQLLHRGESVKIIVRTVSNLPETVNNHQNLSIIHASVVDLSDDEMTLHVKECNAVASCLGHNLSFRGIYGYPPLAFCAKQQFLDDIGLDSIENKFTRNAIDLRLSQVNNDSNDE